MAMNLEQHRGRRPVWRAAKERTGWDVDRWLGLAAAAYLMRTGARRGTAAGWLMAAAGGVLASWLVCSPGARRQRQARQRDAADPVPAASDPGQPPDRVNEASEESFPASDAPSWTSTAASARPYSPGRGPDSR